MIYAVILAGGKGERFWPLSRYSVPKQFLKLVSDKTLIQQTINRIRPLASDSNIHVVTNSLFFGLIRKQLARFKIPPKNILLEPAPKNTAPAIGWAVMGIAAVDPEATIVVLPSDHFIQKKENFLRVLRYAKTLTESEDCLVTFGISPDRAETGYGYIKIKPKLTTVKFYQVERFMEKPNREKAKMFIKDKRYYWNSGVFMFKARVILEEIEKYLPELYKKLAKFNSVLNSQQKLKLWQGMPAISIDYGIMEKSKKVVMIPLNCNWTDLGSWDALAGVFPQDKSENIIYADSIDRDSKNITVWAKESLGTKSRRLIATIGLRDLIIVDTPDALLVCKKEKAQEVKKIVEELKRRGKKEVL